LALDGGEWATSRLRPLYSGQKNPLPIVYEIERAPGTVWTFWRGEKSVVPAEMLLKIQCKNNVIKT
jgi:hypothetical protein